MKKHITLFVENYQAANGVRIASIPGQNQIVLRDLTPAAMEKIVANLATSKHAENFHAQNGAAEEVTIVETCLLDSTEKTWVWKAGYGAKLWQVMSWNHLPWIAPRTESNG